MIALPTYAVWWLGLVVHAATGCTDWYLGGVVALLALLGLGVALTAGNRRGGGAMLLSLVAATALAWILRDQWFLLGDSRLWIRQVTVLGADLEAYRAPVAALVIGFLAEIVDFTGGEGLLAVLSVASGIGVTLLLWRGVERTGAFGAGVATALVFTQPMSFVFFGHIEVYSLFLVALAGLLASLRSDLDRKKVGLATPAVLLLAVFSHFVGFLVVVPLVATWLGRYVGGRTWIPWLVLMGLGAMAGAFVPALRPFTLHDTGVAERLPGYLLDVMNGWFWLGVPLVWLVWRARRELFARASGRMVGWITLTFALFPLLGEFELGVYRDLDLLAPAFVSLVFLTALALARGQFSARSTFLALAPGPILLAGLLALGICPEPGLSEVSRHLDRDSIGMQARAYGAEVLAFAHRQRGDLEQAEATMRRAIEFTPGNRRLYGPLAEFQLERGDTIAAITNLAHSMESHREALSGPLLAELLTRRNRPQEAVDALEPRRDVMLYSGRAAAALAVAYFQLDLPESTLSVSDDRLALAPNDPVAHYNRASALVRLRELRKAEEALGRAITLSPSTVEYHRAYLRLLLAMPDGEDRATEYLTRLPEGLQQAVLQP